MKSKNKLQTIWGNAAEIIASRAKQLSISTITGVRIVNNYVQSDKFRQAANASKGAHNYLNDTFYGGQLHGLKNIDNPSRSVNRKTIKKKGFMN